MRLSLATTLAVALVATAVSSQEPRVVPTSGTGSSHLAITTRSPQAQRLFDTGLSLWHGFADHRSVRAFEAATDLDPNAPMLWWGLALAIGGDDELAERKAAAIANMERARERASALEGRYIDALLAAQDDGGSSYRDELEALLFEYPEELEAHLLLAREVGFRSVYGRTLVQRALDLAPQNHGAHHYWVHAVEGSRPELGLESALLLPRLAPGIGHLVHMPGHVLFQLGRYDEAVDAFEAAADVDRRYMREDGVEPIDHWNHAHNLAYLLAALIETGRVDRADVIAGELSELTVDPTRAQAPEVGTLHYQGALASGYAHMRRGDWAGAARRLESVQLDAATFATAARFREALVGYASARAAIAGKRLDEARERVATLVENHAESRDRHSPSRRLTLDAAVAETRGLLAALEGRSDEAETELRNAVAHEDRLGYREPPRYARPTRETLAEWLIEQGRFAEARTTLNESLERRRESGWSLYLLARANELDGERGAAANAYRRFLAAWSGADANRAELAVAREFVAANTATAATSAQSDAGAPSASAARLRALFTDWDSSRTPGCAVVAVQDGYPVYTAAFGMADIERRVPITPSTVFNIASLSKHFTATVVALLAERGDLAIDDDIREFVPEIPTYEQPIRVRHLLQQTSGLREYFDLVALRGRDIEEAMPLDEMLALIARQRQLNFEPGSEYSYSNTNYLLLAVIVERVAGRPLAEVADELVFEPLGMHATAFADHPDRLVPDRAMSYHERREGGYGRRLLKSSIIGPGGVLTTVEDLLIWERNFLDNQLGKGGPELFAMMTTPAKLTGGNTSDYGFGLSLGDYRGLRTVSHGGTMGGYRSFMLRFPEQRFASYVLCNLLQISPFQLTRRVADEFLGDAMTPMDGPVPLPYLRGRPGETEAPVMLPDATLAQYVGDYVSDELLVTYELRAENGHLVARVGLSAPLPLRPGEPDEFDLGGLPLRFERDGEGRVVSMSASTGRIRRLVFERRQRHDRERPGVQVPG